MILINDTIIVSDDVVNVQFVCNLTACKGACCIQGDMGAPLEAAEVPILEAIYPKVKPYLTPEGVAALEAKGLYKHSEADGYETTLVGEEGACAYVTYDADGTTKCGIERAYIDGAIEDFQKPISCHLYPIRVKQHNTYTLVNYDKWSICSDACALGKKLQVPVYQFLKAPLSRKFGAEFYAELEAAALSLK